LELRIGSVAHEHPAQFARYLTVNRQIGIVAFIENRRIDTAQVKDYRWSNSSLRIVPYSGVP